MSNCTIKLVNFFYTQGWQKRNNLQKIAIALLLTTSGCVSGINSSESSKIATSESTNIEATSQEQEACYKSLQAEGLDRIGHTESTDTETTTLSFWFDENKQKLTLSSSIIALYLPHEGINALMQDARRKLIMADCNKVQHVDLTLSIDNKDVTLASLDRNQVFLNGYVIDQTLTEYKRKYPMLDCEINISRNLHKTKYGIKGWADANESRIKYMVKNWDELSDNNQVKLVQDIDQIVQEKCQSHYYVEIVSPGEFGEEGDTLITTNKVYLPQDKH